MPPRSSPRSRRSRALLAAVGLAAGLVVAAPSTGTAAPAAPSGSASPVAPTAGRDGDGVFTIAVLPDTQMEVLDTSDTRFTNRAQWLSDQRAALDLRYVTSSGDVVNWDTAGHVQYEITRPGVEILDASGVPWSFSIGNHDTMATGPGGSARPGGNAAVDLRVTNTFNAYYGVSHADRLRGTYRSGRIDNSFSTFAAEGRNWLVLNLELWPRPEVVTWARRVVAARPSFNVVVVTHAMLTAEGTVQQDNGGYGATSPQYLLDHLVLAYPNVRFVFSGHAGSYALKRTTGVHGNPVSIIQTTYHSTTTNPVRLVTVNTARNSYSTKVVAPATDETFTDGSASSRAGMAWVTTG